MDAGETIWEDHLTEKKSENDLKDLLKTVVAFANSVQPGHVAQILIGELDDGNVQGVKNPDQLQRKIRETCEKPYPPIVWRVKPYATNGKICLRVEIEYSGETPHFAGPAWIRRGSESLLASDEIFQKLIALRTSKIRELQKWLGKNITVTWIKKDDFREALKSNRHFSTSVLSVLTEFYVTFESAENKDRISEPVGALTLSWDDTKNRLRIFVTPL
jgi:hypothetical protein